MVAGALGLAAPDRLPLHPARRAGGAGRPPPLRWPGPLRQAVQALPWAG
nr:hypothetical protein [Lysobacter enzymogenes]